MSNETAVSIVIPFLNEKDGIDVLLKNIDDYYQQRKFEFEIIFVDDGSTDGTAEIIKSKTSLPYPSTLISLSKNFGAHAAVRAGFTHAKGIYATCLPADLQISFDTVERLYDSALQGNDSVYGVREVNDIGIVEKTFSRFYATMMQRYVNKDFPFKGLETVLISRKVLKVLNANVESNSSFILQILSMGFKHQFVNIEKKNRNIGRSKWTVSKKIKLFIDSFVAFSYAPIRFVTILGILLFVLGLVWSGYIVVRKILFNDIVAGWSALMSILLTGFGITNISLGIIAEYLWRTLDSSRRRPVFIIDEITELEKNG
ncbi:MAG: glycosyl transferase family 2 [Bacteroidetes bacterium]|jgi:dolichol-phosphate mannosyltransferase|nr:glycosyl transferase family 2 [Bacteroidota bacterium]